MVGLSNPILGLRADERQLAIRVHYDDHPPPHFHVRYGGSRAVFLIREGIFSEGVIPFAHG